MTTHALFSLNRALVTMLRTHSIIKSLHRPGITTPFRHQCDSSAADIMRCYSLSIIRGHHSSPSIQTLNKLPFQRRSFSTACRLAQYQQYRSQGEPKKKESITELIVIVAITFAISDTFPFREYIEYPINKLIFG